MIEVLAPAGSLESFKAAVFAGADAVYFGAGDFNARRNAQNFSEEDIKIATSFARVRGVKTYLTLNTLTADSELSAALRTAQIAAESGVDALIVQDLGLIKALKEHLPNMPLHASTQMSVHSKEALPILKEMGIERVVVAREMDKSSLEELCREAKRLGLEVEAFVHGALCMCLSGQCYLSSILGGRSGNRGLCAQPCRLAFSVKNGTGYDLSLKDMSYIKHIGEMAEMGVTSFKIEGRMKRPEYVAAAVQAVRAAADKKEIPLKTQELLSGIFSRSGHTDGYYTNNLGKQMFGVRTTEDESLSAKLINTAHELYRREFQRVPLSAEIKVKTGSLITLTVTDNDGNSVTITGEEPTAAINREVDRVFVSEKLSKCGGTPYVLNDIKCEIDKGLSVSAASLNELRRNAFQQLSDIRSKYDKNKAKESTVSKFMLTKSGINDVCPKTVVGFKRISQIPADLSGVSAVILPLETDFTKVDIPASIPIIVDIPRGIMHTSNLQRKRLEIALQNGVKAALCSNLAAFELARKAGLSIVAGYGMNIYNSESAKAVEKIGAKASVLSFEMSLSDAVRVDCEAYKGIISYGRLPLMIFRNCPNKNGDGCEKCNGLCELRDRKNIVFPIMCNGELSELYNSRPVWLFDRINELKGLDFQVIMFTDESPERCDEILSANRNKKAPDVEFTRGLYYREVL